VVIDREGKVALRTREWTRARGLAWSARGDEVWFSAAEARANQALRAVRIDGRERVVHESPGSLTLWDVAPDGRVLLAREDERMAVVGMPPGATSERDLSWFDTAGLASISDDGRLLLFGDRFGIYLRKTDGSPAAKLGSAQGPRRPLARRDLVLATGLSASGLFRPPPDRDSRTAVEGTVFSGSLWFGGPPGLVNGREAGHDWPTSWTYRGKAAVTEEGTGALSIAGWR
jgi:hypothetical protein